MHLQTPTTSFHLQIVGYEFPDIEPRNHDQFDSNWLLIRTTATTPEGTWTVKEPSLLTSEIQELIDWFDSIATPTVDPILRFTEPNISFYLTASPTSQPTLHVHLAAESRPPWSRNTSQDTILTFPLSELDPAAVTQSLRSQLAQFPPRNL
jgi:hypothetical protein